MFSRCSIYVVTSVDTGDESRSPQTQRSKLSGIAQLQKARSHRCGYGFPGLCRVGVLRTRVAASVLLIIAEQRTSGCVYLGAVGGHLHSNIPLQLLQEAICIWVHQSGYVSKIC